MRRVYCHAQGLAGWIDWVRFKAENVRRQVLRSPDRDAQRCDEQFDRFKGYRAANPAHGDGQDTGGNVFCNGGFTFSIHLALTLRFLNSFKDFS